MPPALRNNRTPTAADTPASAPASPLQRPAAIALQNSLQFSRKALRRRLCGGNVPPTHRSERPHLFIATSMAEVLRRPVESALDHPPSRVMTFVGVEAAGWGRAWPRRSRL